MDPILHVREFIGIAVVFQLAFRVRRLIAIFIVYAFPIICIQNPYPEPAIPA
jgi:hypothetical protein